MEKKTYFQTMYRRRNVIAEALLGFFLGLSSWPRMLIETPIRRNMGERYFSYSGAIMLAVLLGLLPFLIMEGLERFHGHMSVGKFMGLFTTWYAYLAVFVYCAMQRRDEIKRLPGVFDFERFSLSNGEIHPVFRQFELNGRRFDRREIETLIEPGFFFFIGFGFWIVGQPIGFVLVVSSIFYAFSYIAAYRDGENWLMDKIDERICNEELAHTFKDGTSPGRGFHFYGRRPVDPDARRRVADMLMHDEETVEAM